MGNKNNIYAPETIFKRKIEMNLGDYTKIDCKNKITGIKLKQKRETSNYIPNTANTIQFRFSRLQIFSSDRTQPSFNPSVTYSIMRELARTTPCDKV